ncbi:MAG TPA: hypothetical protein VMU90_04160 [Solirubrobacteraceae bacterium]|nr:hypothetical protein [Solirubrobacteraceae bacterium]
MEQEVEAPRHHAPILRRVFAGAVLIIAVALALKLVIGFVIAIFWVVVVAAIAIAILWALKTLIW